jgi:hypothetical protein
MIQSGTRLFLQIRFANANISQEPFSYWQVDILGTQAKQTVDVMETIA